MSEWRELTAESQSRWDENAEFWDDYMGEHSNRFHREIIRPKTEELLAVREGQTILDIACGNGNFSRRLAELGAHVLAFDFSAVMIERAKARSVNCPCPIDYQVVDATSDEALMGLGAHTFDSAVSNMGLMDIADITPLIKALHVLLKDNGKVVFSIPHPCFQTPGLRKIHETEESNGQIVSRNSIQISKYLLPEPFESIGIQGQPVPHYIFHRPLSYYVHLFLSSGFVLDGMEEPSFEKDEVNSKFDWYDIPPVIILRFMKR